MGWVRVQLGPTVSLPHGKGAGARIVVAAVIAYLRFGRKSGVALRSKPGGGGAVASVYELPDLPEWALSAAGSSGARLPYKPPSRDLFAPMDRTVSPTGKPSSHNGVPILSGTIQGGKGTLAIINDKVVAVGDKIGEYTVVKIGHDSAVLSRGTAQHVVKKGN